MKKQTIELEKPGAALPFLESLFVRYYIGPFVSKKFTWEENAARYKKETTKILQLIEGIPAHDLVKKTLVPPIKGIEDSSRNWSIIMTLEHLLIVSGNMAKFVELLSNGIQPEKKVDIAKVKPHEAPDPTQIMEQFKNSVNLAQSTLEKVKHRNSKLKHYHPWFGRINAGQWFWLMSAHQTLHRTQVEKIIEILKIPEASPQS